MNKKKEESNTIINKVEKSLHEKVKIKKKKKNLKVYIIIYLL
jgi:hypothetical protein